MKDPLRPAVPKRATSFGHPTFAIVPARGGSKGLVRKNLRELSGLSLVAHAIECARGARAVDDVFVSSEDEEIRAEARRAGATAIPRPSEFATDEASTDVVLSHAIEWIQRERSVSEFRVVLLQPTSPLRRSEHVDAACALLSADTSAVVSTVRPSRHPLKSLVTDESGFLTGAFGPDAPFSRRQDLPGAVHANGAIYVFRAKDFQRSGRIPRSGIRGYEMTAEDSLDIDTERDLMDAMLVLDGRGGSE